MAVTPYQFAQAEHTLLVSALKQQTYMSSSQCVQRASILPSLSSSLPECNRTRREGKLLVLTNQVHIPDRRIQEHEDDQ